MWHATLDLPDELRERAEALSAQSGQSLQMIVTEALAEHLARIEEEDARVRTAMAEADLGETIDVEDLRAEDDALIARLGVTPEERAAIRAEVEAEQRAFYGV